MGLNDREDEFAAFVATRQLGLHKTAWLLTGDWAAAQDLVQTALAKTWRRWRRAGVADNRDAYVRRVLINTFLSARRRRWLGEIPSAAPPEAPSPQELGEEVATRIAVADALARLTRRQRAVVVLRYLHDLPEAQVADVLGCAVGTVKSTGAKALRHLREDPALLDLVGEVPR